MGNLQQIRRIAFNDEEIGMGFNSETGQAVGSPLASFAVPENPDAPGQVVSSSMMIVNTHDELQQSLGMSFEAQGRYGLFSASAKAKFSESTHYNSTSTFLVAQVVVANPLKRGKNFQVTETAKELLTAQRFDEFGTAFGDSFVRGLQTGGEFYAVIRITSLSQSTQTSLSASLQAEMNGLVAAGSFKAEFQTAQSSESTRSEFTATMYQKAGSGAEVAPTVSIDDVVGRFKKFPEFVKNNAGAYETELATYDTLPLPVPTAEEREDFLIALSDARDKKLRYIQTRNDLDFATQHPEFFQNLPALEVLQRASAVYTALINAVMSHAIRLSRGQISPPRLFDPNTLVPPLIEPAPVPLIRVAEPVGPVPPGMVRVPGWRHQFEIDPLPGMSPIPERPPAKQVGLRAHLFVTIRPTMPDPLDVAHTIVRMDPPAGSVVPIGTTVIVKMENTSTVGIPGAPVIGETIDEGIVPR